MVFGQTILNSNIVKTAIVSFTAMKYLKITSSVDTRYHICILYCKPPYKIINGHIAGSDTPLTQNSVCTM
jgi:hypothetical protein